MLAHPDATFAVVYCRAGMEGDCAAELVELAAASGVPAWCRAGEGWVELVPTFAGGVVPLAHALRFEQLVFARQWFAGLSRIEALPPGDRATPLAMAIADHVEVHGGLRLEHPDTDTGRPLARLCRSLAGPLGHALAEAGVHEAEGAPVLHVLFLPDGRARIGLSDPANASPWPLGIPRLKMPGAAPSRSVLKLEEAFTLFLSEPERHTWLRPGRNAVDLGAAPGGWTWLLLERGLSVEAVDNGPMAPAVANHPRLAHRRADGFLYRPRGPVDWLVCDMVEQPQRIARLATVWLQRGDCRHAVVNLKLPMKRRWHVVRDNLARVSDALPAEGRLAARQLYHDRDEVTVFATRDTLGPI